MLGRWGIHAALPQHCTIQDIIVSLVLAGGHFVGGVLQAVYGDDWNDNDVVDDDDDDVKTIKRSMIASAVSP